MDLVDSGHVEFERVHGGDEELHRLGDDLGSTVLTSLKKLNGGLSIFEAVVAEEGADVGHRRGRQLPRRPVLRSEPPARRVEPTPRKISDVPMKRCVGKESNNSKDYSTK